MKLFGVEYEQTPARTEPWDNPTDQNHLACPICSPYQGIGGCLHHEAVYVFNRTSEDSPTGLLALIEGQSITGNGNGDMETMNPSERRNGLLIEFWCEICGYGLEDHHPLYLAIVQHKGQTEVSWFVPK